MATRLETPAEVADLHAALHEIADTVGVPVKAFTDQYGREARELLRLWCILSSEGRERLLEKAHELTRGGASIGQSSALHDPRHFYTPDVLAGLEAYRDAQHDKDTLPRIANDLLGDALIEFGCTPYQVRPEGEDDPDA